jgi:chromatin segregation and condensation protein Rec8/ScpA/Scc1 (kleisin family)
LALSKETPVPSKNTPVPIPEPIDDEYLCETGEGQQPQGLPSRLEFFVYAMKLLDIKAKSRIAETQHLITGRKRYSAEELGASLDMVSDLDQFLEDLPIYLQRDREFALPESRNETCFKLQARVLRAR